MLGLAGAVVMLTTFAFITAKLLRIVGLLVAGGCLLLWVCWKMWRDLRDGEEEPPRAKRPWASPAWRSATPARRRPKAKTLGHALVQILMADLAMSLDNVLAVAGAARQHPWVLFGGLLLSITLTGLAASWIAKLLQRFRWIAYLGLVIVIYVALHMIWEGTRTVAIDTGQTHVYNKAMPDPLDIKPGEVAKRKAK